MGRGKEQESPTGDWQIMLGKARERLLGIRDALITTWFEIHKAENQDERIVFGKNWGELVREEVALTEDVIAPLKIELGLPITNRNQERRIKRRTEKLAEKLGGTPEQGVEIVRRHIRLTKRIQKRLGVENRQSS